MTVSEDRLARLEAALDAQQRQIDLLRAENAAPRRAPSTSASDAPPSPPVSPLGRRSLLTKGLAAAGAATAGAVLVGVEPAAASNGQSLVIGGNNFGTAATRLNVTAPGTDGGLQIIDSGGLGAPPNKTALVVSATGSPLLDGIFVTSAGTGVTVTTNATAVLASGGASGLYGIATQNGGNGVVGTGTTGVYGSGSAFGVRGYSPVGSGVDASGDDYGVKATATGPSSTGVDGYGEHIGVRGSASTGTGTLGVLGQARTGVHGQATAAAGTGVLAENTGGVALRSTGRGGALLDASEFHLRLANTATRRAPTGDTIAHQRGDLVETTAGELWLCTTAGTPGTWRKLAGPNTAGAFHVLPSPARVYDSRPGTAPAAVGPKTPFAAGTTRTFDLKVNGSLVPAGATAAMVTLLLVNAATANGNLTVWANGVAKPVANTLVWGGSARRFTATAVTALDTQARIQVNASAPTDLVIDVVGFYR